MIWTELKNLKEKDALCYFCYRPKEKCICKKEKDPFKECSVKGYDIDIIHCNHPEDMTEEICRKSPNRSMCIIYRKCKKCGAETVDKFVERCYLCLKEISEEHYYE